MDRPAPAALGFARRALPLVAAATAAAIVLGACTATGGASPSSSSGSGAAAPLVGTTWMLTDYVGPDGTSLPVPAALSASATFDGSRIAGNAGCNHYSGPYVLDGDKMTISTLSMTAMACPDAQMKLEQAYTAALARVATYAISGDVLELKTAEGVVGLRFKATAAPSLTKTRWVATGINNGTGAVTSAVAGTDVTAIFAEDGTVAGNGGCNTYNGGYTVDGSKLTFGALATTRKACTPEALAQQESAYFAALARVATFAFAGDTLELRAADGSLQVSYRPTAP